MKMIIKKIFIDPPISTVGPSIKVVSKKKTYAELHTLGGVLPKHHHCSEPVYPL